MKITLLLSLCLVIALTSLRAQLTQINNNNSLQVSIPLAAGKTILVSEIDSSLWITDATAAGTVPISQSIKYEGLVGVLADKLIFTGRTAATGSEIFITDGTPAGTQLVKDIFPGSSGSLPADEGARLGDFIYFTAVTSAEGRELWRTNGTTAGTTLVKDIVPGTASSNDINLHHLFSNGSYLLFSARNGALGIELWRSDGTDAGTVPLMDINPGAASSSPRSFFWFNNMVLFVATDAAHGEEPWVTDGSPGGTALLKDINAGNKNSTTLEIVPGFGFPVFQYFHQFNNRVYFNAFDGGSSGEVWGTDGTPANTSLLKDVIPGLGLSFILLVDAVNLPDKFIFPVSNGADRSELWESDGTPGGTKLFKAFAPGDASQFPLIFLNISGSFSLQSVSDPLYQYPTIQYPLFQGNKFFFAAPTLAEGYELWISDGSAAGTHIVKDINPNTGNGIDINEISWLYTTEQLFFAANDGSHGNELWKTNGTDPGTTMVQDINPGAGSSNPTLPFVSFGKVIFMATEGNHPTFTDLFALDGTFTALPVSLLDYTVQLNGTDALIQWNTVQEVNSRYFTVQRSYDGVHFESIGVVRAQGSSSGRRSYSFTDAGIVQSGRTVVYYRLVAADIDGRTNNTNVISLKLKGNSGWNVQLLSNPVADNITILLSGITETIKLSVVDLNGKLLNKRSLQNINGVVKLPAANLQRGVYFLIAETGNERKTLRIVK